MPLAVTHVILTIVLIDLYRDYFSKLKFPTFFVLIGGIAGLLPDMDIPISWITGLILQEPVWFHRTYTHAFIFPIAFTIIAFAIHRVIKKKKYTLFGRKTRKDYTVLFFAMLAAGWMIHILLDGFLGGPEQLSWIPVIAPIISFPAMTVSLDIYRAAALDATILVLWLAHEEFAHRIKDYI